MANGWPLHRWNPDSREIYIQPISKPGRKSPVTVTGGYMPRWRGNGRELYYVTPGLISSVSLWANGGTLHAIDVTATGGRIAFGTPRKLFAVPPTCTDGTAIGYVYDVTSDGQRFLFEIATPTENCPAAHPFSGLSAS